VNADGHGDQRQEADRLIFNTKGVMTMGAAS
jgi:hypothetical protein